MEWPDKSHRGTGVQGETEWRLGRMVGGERDSQNEHSEWTLRQPRELMYRRNRESWCTDDAQSAHLFKFIKKSNKSPESPRANLVRFLPSHKHSLQWCRNPGRKPERRRHHVVSDEFAICGCHPVARGTPPRTSPSAAGHEGGPRTSFCALVQDQQEERELIRSWMDREVRAGGIPPAPALSTHMPLQKMGPQDDPEAFLDLFEKTAEACGWPQVNWPVRLIPLLSGEAQLAAQQLPVQNLLVYDDLKRAILQRVGRNPEQHRQRFRSLELGENGRPFVMAHQLRDACRRWLLAGEGDVDQIIDRVVLEQFIARLPKKTAQWVQCHRPTSLDLAIQLAEDQMAACHGVGETLPSVSLSLPSSSSFSPPSFLPRSRAACYPGPSPDGGEDRHRSRRPWEPTPGRRGQPARAPLLFPFLRGLHANSLSHFPPLGWRGSLGRPVGVAGTRATLSIGVWWWRWGHRSGFRTPHRLPPIRLVGTK